MTKLNLQLLLKKYNLEKNLDIEKITLNDDGTIDYDGDVDLWNLNLKEIPIPFNKINGDFNCGYNNLTSLKNCPKIVNGEFDCRGNKLKSLEGSPKIINGNIYCGDNNLTSLKGCTPIINGDFDCSYNQIKFTEEDVKKVSKVKCIIYI